MKKIFSLILLSIFLFSTSLFAKSRNDPNWFVGLGATISGDSSAMVPTYAGSPRYTETEYDTDISEGMDQASIHVGYLWDMYDGFEVSYSRMVFNNSADTKEGTLTLTELDWLIGFQDWSIGFTNQEIDLIVPYMKVGVGMASWSDNDSSTTEDISGSVGKLGLGLLLHFATNFWGDISYNVRSIGFLSTNAAEQSPLQTANFTLKIFF